MSDIVNIKNLDELDAEYVLICKDADDIFNDLKFNNKKEEDTCRMIIDFIEKTISKESARGLYFYEENKIKAETIRKRVLDKIKKRNNKRYIRYCMTLGKAYADAFLYCMSIFEEVPFNFELQEKYDELTNRKHN